MIITVTLNPALDKTARVDVVRANALNRLRDVTLDAGGKGVNVSALIRSLGGESIAVGFWGGGAGKELQSLIAKRGLKSDFVRIAAVTRTNLKVVADDGGLTEFNEPGPRIDPDEWRELEEKLSGYGIKGNTVVLSGSLPAGLGQDTYKKLSVMLRRAGAAVFLDADGEALRYALESGPEGVPDYLKPNRYELLQYFGIPDDEGVTETKLADLCRALIGKGLKLVVLSLGEAGAIFANGNGIWRAPAVPVQVRSTVGAGDSMIGALAYGFEQGLPEERCFALAMAASAGTCTTEGTNPPLRALVDTLLTQVRIEKIAG
ncbi:MAG: 1-phosphofructokinase family hexose kinase [Treponema sp.]|jgi:1-phosphofructokinase|nr:1-phosphofructokinase family hexose kinase [Treponema sp.]